jgi:hypothetical protein
MDRTEQNGHLGERRPASGISVDEGFAADVRDPVSPVSRTDGATSAGRSAC